MNTSEIYARLSNTLPVHVTVCASNHLPYPEKRHAVVVNFDDSGYSGTHWIGIACDADTAYILDSARITPLPTLIEYWLYKHFSKQIINKTTLQPFYTNVCGLHVIYFLEQYFVYKRTFRQILDTYSLSNLTANNVLVVNYVNHRI